jgi:methionyl-tRNA synthetase
MNNRFYITTPIYYPNGEPHLGSVYTTTICDVLARYHRLRGEATYFLTGTDEHGTKMAKAAAEAGTTPLELATRYAEIFRATWGELKISNDDFIRTTEPRHRQVVQAIVSRLVETGDIYLGGYKGWYDEGQEEFVTETQAKENQYRSAISGKPLIQYSEPSYFFRLSFYVPKLIEYIEAHPEFIIPQSRRNEVLSKLRAGVDDLSISRASLKWGIPMPNDPEHVVYVWIDALANYISALGYGTADDAKFRQFWPADVHVIGKDILCFHTVYWPALLMALKLELPRTVAAHGWWIRGGKKAGKSTGGITTLPEIRELVGTYSLDVLRYHLLRAAPFGSDLEWSPEEFTKAFSELGNVVGNLLNRVLKMVNDFRGGVLPAIAQRDGADDAVTAAIGRLPAALDEAYEKLELQQLHRRHAPVRHEERPGQSRAAGHDPASFGPGDLPRPGRPSADHAGKGRGRPATTGGRSGRQDNPGASRRRPAPRPQVRPRPAAVSPAAEGRSSRVKAHATRRDDEDEEHEGMINPFPARRVPSSSSCFRVSGPIAFSAG